MTRGFEVRQNRQSGPYGGSPLERESTRWEGSHSVAAAFGSPLRDDHASELYDSRNERRSVLWIDDVSDEACVRLLTLEGFDVACATTGASGVTMARAHAYDAYIIDLHLPDMYGLTVLERLTAEGPRVPALILTGCYTEPESEALARQLGAADFRRKPISSDELTGALRAAIDARPSSNGSGTTATPRREAIEPNDHPRFREPRFGIVAASRATRAIMEWIDHVGPTEMPVLLTGETGTGKGLVAKALHDCSKRCCRRFVSVSCSAIPEGLLETELFGHRRGAFTGAFQDKKGLLEEAADGTLFLDEIGEMTLPAQVRLLRFLEDGEMRRVGDTRSKRIEVRVIAATNRPLLEEAAQGRFRQDLYFRLAVARRHLPPLRGRQEDIDALIEYWLPQMAEAAGKRVGGVSSSAAAVLRNHPWPGNIRELRNVIEYAVSVADSDRLTEQDVAAALSPVPSGAPDARGDASRADEARQTLSALERSRWNRTRAARVLGVNRSTLWRRLRKYGIDKPDDN